MIYSAIPEYWYDGEIVRGTKINTAFARFSTSTDVTAAIASEAIIRLASDTVHDNHVASSTGIHGLAAGGRFFTASETIPIANGGTGGTTTATALIGIGLDNFNLVKVNGAGVASLPQVTANFPLYNTMPFVQAVNATGQVIVNGAESNLSLTNISSGSTFFDGTSFTAPYTGTYLVDFVVQFASGTTLGNLESSELKKNGVALSPAVWQGRGITSIGPSTLESSRIVNLTVGETLRLSVWNGDTARRTLSSGACYLTLQMLHKR